MAKYRANSSDTWKTLKIKALDSMPVGTQVEYTGNNIPVGWEQVNDYSTTEIDTGKRWIDGKKIYRKVGTGTSVSGGIVQLNMNLTNIDTMVKYSGTYNSIYPIPYATTTPGFTIETYKNNTNIDIVFGSSIQANKPFIIIVEYTKTS